jgi:DNA invertase Pin-like site-specific DNA recombinase
VRQNAELLALAQREGWDVIETLTDDGKSGGKQREKAQHALAMLASGEVDILAVYAVDRWSRMGIGDSGPIITAVNAHGGRFVAARESIDSKTDPDYWKLRLAFALDTAEKERNNTIARVNSSQRFLRAQGYWEGGRVPFGYAPVSHPENPGKRTLIVRESEAAIIRELAERLAAGELPSRLALELTDRGVPTPASARRRAETLSIAGKPLPADLDVEDRGNWSTQSVQSIMTSDTLLGRRTEWVLEKAESADGKTYDKKRALRVIHENGIPRQWWPAILTPGELEAVRAKVNNPEDRGKYRARVPQRQKATRLLSGLAVCATCGSKLYVTHHRSERDKLRLRIVYRCAANTSLCREKAAVTAETFEAFVVNCHLREFGDVPEYRASTVTDAQADHAAALADVEIAISEALTALRESATAERFAALQALQAQRETLQASTPSIETVYTPTGRTHAEAWAAAQAENDVDYMRDLLRWHYSEVRVRKGRQPLAERVTPIEAHLYDKITERDTGGDSTRGPSDTPRPRTVA